MRKGGTGESNTLTGLLYEAKVDLKEFLNAQKGYKVQGTYVYYQEKLVARIFKKYALYKYLAENGIDWKRHISKRLLPDNCIYVIVNNTMYILEVKHQQVAGSVDEKLQTCDFKKKQYIKLFAMDGVELSFEPEVFEFIVDKAIEYKLGARGLRSIVETIMIDTMYEVPSKHVTEFKVTLDYAKQQLGKANLSRLQNA